MALPPMMAIQTITISDGITTTPRMKSRMVRPCEIRAMKAPTNGENDRLHDQMNTVHQPFQLSFQWPKPVTCNWASVHRPMANRLLR